MAKAKTPTAADAVKVFKDVLKRAAVESYLSVNDTMLFEDKTGNTILVIPDIELFGEIIKNKKDIIGKELDISIPEESEKLWKFQYGEGLCDGWFDIDATDDLFTGKIFKIKIKDHEYKIPISRDLMPLKLKKAEYVDISYKVFGSRKNISHGAVSVTPLVLAIKKRFNNPLRGYGFTVVRLFQVV